MEEGVRFLGRWRVASLKRDLRKIQWNSLLTPATIPIHEHARINAGDVTRRDFIRGGSFATLMTLLGGVELKAAAPRNAEGKELIGPKVKLGLIGLGPWGREILSTLQQIPEADIAAVCDNYPTMLRRSASNVPGAKAVEDYRAILDDKDIKAVLVATPTHLHKEIVLAALQAGKHVYCEVPLANTIDDAKAIAKAARGAVGQVFQSGLCMRSDPQRHFLLSFVRSGAVGRFLMARAQWHKKQSWRFTSPNAEREKTINWRLSRDISLGLVGEVGINQIDATSWFLRGLPKAVTGWGDVLCWTTAATCQTPSRPCSSIRTACRACTTRC